MPKGLSPPHQPPHVVCGADVQPSLSSPGPERRGCIPGPPRRDTVSNLQKGSVYTGSHILLTLSVLVNANLQEGTVDMALSKADHKTILPQTGPGLGRDSEAEPYKCGVGPCLYLKF